MAIKNKCLIIRCGALRFLILENSALNFRNFQISFLHTFRYKTWSLEERTLHSNGNGKKRVIWGHLLFLAPCARLVNVHRFAWNFGVPSPKYEEFYIFKNKINQAHLCLLPSRLTSLLERRRYAYI